MVELDKGWGIFGEEEVKGDSPPKPEAFSDESSDNSDGDNDGALTRYLLMRLGDEIYGTSLLNVREIIEPIVPKPIPNTSGHFIGVINLRGQIVSIIDLKKKFNMASKGQEPRQAYVIFETPSGPIGAIVDEVTQVAALGTNDIDVNVKVQARMPLSFLTGIARLNDKLVTLIDLKLVLGSDELVSIRSLRNIAA